MNKTEQDLPDVNKRIIEKLQKNFPTGVSELAIKAIQLAEQRSVQAVVEELLGHVRQIARKQGGAV